MITITENAADHIRKFLTKRGKGEGIRIGVKTSGCSGMAYTLEFVDEIQPEDQVFEQDGVKVFIDPKSMVYLDGTQVDFAKEGLQEG
ncbi:MAG: iron-sulfur cluster assembly accessory protein, partial [Kingella sp. (in: b-proteobacteria)]